jgi:hypothetical protein
MEPGYHQDKYMENLCRKIRFFVLHGIAMPEIHLNQMDGPKKVVHSPE